MRGPSKQTSLTIGQIATRWNVGPERVRALIRCGRLSGAFQIPSAGRYGATIKVPLSVVVEAEQQWALAIGGRPRTAPPPRKNGESRVVLKHLPQFNDEPPPAAECPVDARH